MSLKADVMAVRRVGDAARFRSVPHDARVRSGRRVEDAGVVSVEVEGWPLVHDRCNGRGIDICLGESLKVSVDRGAAVVRGGHRFPPVVVRLCKIPVSVVQRADRAVLIRDAATGNDETLVCFAPSNNVVDFINEVLTGKVESGSREACR